jgi:hypothetical protein
MLDAGALDVAHVARVDALVLGDNDLAFTVGDVEARDFTTQTLGNELEFGAIGAQRKVVEHKEVGKNLLNGHADRLQQDRDRHLAATIDAEEQDVFRVELEIQPGATVRNDAGREQQLAGRVRLAAVMFKEHARRAVQLRHDDALGAIDHEGASGGHERQFTHVHFLFLHFLDDRLGRRFLVQNHQAHLGTQRRGKGQAALLAFLDIERRVTQHVGQEFETRKAIVRNDGENGRKGRLQPLVLALRRHPVGL